ncbi:LbtU family siderophore porin [Desulfospira joergensenii]|uniref:LbtU family siderophore porin n=1 Tax=Desulfospira joergensenii TaxID=53329 RepID=UPI0003B5232C|nr:LbtU family siderophore porin [Desulfospira joergensenii]
MKRANAVLGLVTALAMILMGAMPGFSASNAELEERITKLEKETEEGSVPASLGQISEWVSLSGTLEVEVGFESSDVNDTDNSDISLATAELGIEASPQEWVTGFVLLSWEDDDDKFTADEAHITLGATDQIPYYLSAGRLYVPFGSFETMMVSDPITQDFAETRDEAVQVGIEMNGIRAAAFAFNGEAEEANENDDTIDVFGLSLGHAMETEAFSLDLGVDWINNILESGGLREVYDDSGWAAALEDQVPAVSLHAVAGFGPVSLMGEYVVMTDDVVAAGGVKLMDEASAYALEIGYTFDLAGYESTFALGYQGSDDAEELLPESKYLAALGVGITDNLWVNFEYSSADNYSVADGGDGDDIDTFTIQMAFEF